MAAIVSDRQAKTMTWCRFIDVTSRWHSLRHRVYVETGTVIVDIDIDIDVDGDAAVVGGH
jgi:hypothetical protein